MGKLEVVVPLVLDDASQHSSFHIEYPVQSAGFILVIATMNLLDQLVQRLRLCLGNPS